MGAHISVINENELIENEIWEISKLGPRIYIYCLKSANCKNK